MGSTPTPGTVSPGIVCRTAESAPASATVVLVLILVWFLAVIAGTSAAATDVSAPGSATLAIFS